MNTEFHKKNWKNELNGSVVVGCEIYVVLVDVGNGELENPDDVVLGVCVIRGTVDDDDGILFIVVLGTVPLILGAGSAFCIFGAGNAFIALGGGKAFIEKDFGGVKDLGELNDLTELKLLKDFALEKLLLPPLAPPELLLELELPPLARIAGAVINNSNKTKGKI